MDVGQQLAVLNFSYECAAPPYPKIEIPTRLSEVNKVCPSLHTHTHTHTRTHTLSLSDTHTHSPPPTDAHRFKALLRAHAKHSPADTLLLMQLLKANTNVWDTLMTAMEPGTNSQKSLYSVSIVEIY